MGGGGLRNGHGLNRVRSTVNVGTGITRHLSNTSFSNSAIVTVPVSSGIGVGSAHPLSSLGSFSPGATCTIPRNGPGRIHLVGGRRGRGRVNVVSGLVASVALQNTSRGRLTHTIGRSVIIVSTRGRGLSCGHSRERGNVRRLGRG